MKIAVVFLLLALPVRAFSQSDIQTFKLDDIRSYGKPWYPFVDHKTMLLGVYKLQPGQPDRQPPHEYDEIYFILEGSGTLSVNSDSLKVEPGSVIFVRAHLPHAFHHYRSPLTVLVFFSKAVSRTSDPAWRIYQAGEKDWVAGIDFATLSASWFAGAGTPVAATAHEDAMVLVWRGNVKLKTDKGSIVGRAGDLFVLDDGPSWRVQREDADVRLLVVTAKH